MRAPLNRPPGYSSGSYGYHGDDGQHFSGHGQGVPYGPAFTRQDGDVIGCMVNFVEQTLSYTRNGVLLGVAHKHFPLDDPLYPAVGLRSPGEVIEANFGALPFRYDMATATEAVGGVIQTQIKGAVQPAAQQAAPAKLVLDYLLHHGYKEAALAFAASSGVAELSEEEQGDVQSRQELKARVLRGDIDGAFAVMKEACPTLFDERPEVIFQLKCQQFIEMMAEHRPLDEAMTFCQAELAEVPQGEEATLQNVLALLAYEEPESSPMAYLLHPEQRARIAELLNSAILGIRAQPTESQLSMLCKHAVTVGDAMVEFEVPGAKYYGPGLSTASPDTTMGIS